jgi:hypothetical protein
MNLLDIYVSEVGRHLPRKSRADIEAEIRSVLQDMVEERSRQISRPVDDEITIEVLKKYGDPEKVAATYLPERYLIGPHLYPIFWIVIRVVLAVIGVLALIGLGIALGQPAASPENVLKTIFKALADFGASAISVLGNVVLVFAILEWALYRAGVKMKDIDIKEGKEWDPRSLARISPPDRVSRGETILEIVGCFAGIVIFNFYPQIVSFTPSLNSVVETGNWTVVPFLPLLSEAFFRYVPFLTAIWGLTLVLDVVLLRQGFWNSLTRWFAIALKVAGVILAIAMLTGPSLLTPDIESIFTSLGAADGGRILFTLLSQMIRVALGIAIIFGGLDIVKSVIHLFPRKATPLPVNK